MRFADHTGPKMQQQKQHAACDQCRRRKLKCSGEKPSCLQCQDERITCIYSPRKVMGRPRKRRREDEKQQDSLESQTSVEAPVLPGYSGINSEVSFGAFPMPDFDDWALPPADVAANHDDNMPGVLQNNTDLEGFDLTLQDDELGTGLTSGQGFLPPSPFSLEGSSDNAPVIQGDIVKDSVSIGQFYAAQAAEEDTDTSLEPCACLTSMYLAASNLETSRTAGFPTALTPLKSAMQTAKTILLCRKCPTEVTSGRQNVMLLTSLLNSIAMGFYKLLKSIDTEAERAQAASEMKTMDVGDRSLANIHLHTGTEDCPAAFSMDLKPTEWSTLTKRVVKKSIWRNDPNDLTLERLIEGTEARQKAWHATKQPPFDHNHVHGADPHTEKDFNCLRLTAEVRRIMSMLPQ